jgi:hypothetical protein
MRRAVLAVIAITLASESAGAHCYRIWNYPRPQHCRATALAPKSAFRLSRARIEVSLKAAPPARPVTPAPEMRLPSLADIDWGHRPDDELRGRLLLRVILQGKEDR